MEVAVAEWVVCISVLRIGSSWSIRSAYFSYCGALSAVTKSADFKAVTQLFPSAVFNDTFWKLLTHASDGDAECDHFVAWCMLVLTHVEVEDGEKDKVNAAFLQLCSNIRKTLRGLIGLASAISNLAGSTLEDVKNIMPTSGGGDISEDLPMVGRASLSKLRNK